MSTWIPIAMAALLLAQQHPPMPAGMSHEEHRKQLERDEALRKRGADAMGFDQDATTHHFRLTAAGGVIEVTVVTVRPTDDSGTLAAVRNHLRSIAGDFSRGDFQKPFQTHGEVPPGVRAMQKHRTAIAYTYEDAPGGGVVRIETRDAAALKAVHDFLRYQITEHRTGDALEPKR